MEIQKQSLIEQIQKIIREKILTTESLANVDDRVLAGLDSIGRLTLLVELENITGTELMGSDMQPEIFASFDTLSDFIVKIAGNQGGSP